MKIASSDITGHYDALCPTGGHYRKIANAYEAARGAVPEYEEHPKYGNHLVVECPVCEPNLIGKDSWTSDPHNIPLTADEKAEATRLEKEGLKQSALMAQALAELANERVASRA